MLKAFLEKNNIQLDEEFIIGKNHYRVIKDINDKYYLMCSPTGRDWYLSTMTANGLEQAEIIKTTYKLSDTYYAPQFS